MPHHRMSVEYLAGFFDEEGSIGVKPNGGYYLSIAQKGQRGKLALNEIRSFLLCYRGIRSALYRPYRVEMHTMSITKREEVIRACRLLLPYIHIKRTEVQDMLRLNLLFPQMTADNPAGRLRYKEGQENRRASSGF